MCDLRNIKLLGVNVVKYLFPIFLLLFITGCTTTKHKQDEEFTITSFSQGKMKKVDGEYQIYEEINEMNYEINDRCIYSKEKIDCLRHGFMNKSATHSNLSHNLNYQTNALTPVIKNRSIQNLQLVC